jgi:DNA-binding NarL/FixJ family response regulator
MIRVAIVDDHPLFRSGVIQTLQSADDVMVVGQGGSVEDAIRLGRELAPDVMILDMNLAERRDGLRAAEAIASGAPTVRILMLTVVSDSASIREAINRGVRGYVLKGIGGAELMEAVRTVHCGEGYLTPRLAASLFSNVPSQVEQAKAAPSARLSAREGQILAFMARGLSNKEIGLHLKLSDKTVKHYVTHLFHKLQVRNRTQAALVASSPQWRHDVPSRLDHDHDAPPPVTERRRSRMLVPA